MIGLLLEMDAREYGLAVAQRHDFLEAAGCRRWLV